MPNIYTREQLWENYKKAPMEIKEYLTSEKTSSVIDNIFEENKVTGANRSFVSDLISQVLLGVILVEELQTALEEKIKNKDSAKILSQSINRYVFSPVAEHLKTSKIQQVEEKIAEESPVEPKEDLKAEKQPKASDTYRESVE